jgi:ubiquinone/menaquinone biosynthesis C-methylase UbiE
VTVFDINAEMLEVGKQRAQAQGEQQRQPSAYSTAL